MDSYLYQSTYGDTEDIRLPIAVCSHCGKGIYEPDEAMIINVSNSVVHMDCWVDYAEENYEEFLSDFYG